MSTRRNMPNGSYLVPGLVVVLLLLQGCVKSVPPPAPPPVAVRASDAPPPTPPNIVRFEAQPATVTQSGSSTLRWVVQNATDVIIDHGIGKVQLSGEQQVRPDDSTTYTLTASGAGGTRSATVTVTITVEVLRALTRPPETAAMVVPPPEPPSVTLVAKPTEVGPAGVSTLFWSSQNATVAVLTVTAGAKTESRAVETTGTLEVMPTETTLYTIAVRGPGGEASNSVTVKVVRVVTDQRSGALVFGALTYRQSMKSGDTIAVTYLVGFEAWTADLKKRVTPDGFDLASKAFVLKPPYQNLYVCLQGAGFKIEPRNPLGVRDSCQPINVEPPVQSKVSWNVSAQQSGSLSLIATIQRYVDESPRDKEPLEVKVEVGENRPNLATTVISDPSGLKTWMEIVGGLISGAGVLYASLRKALRRRRLRRR